MPAAIPIEVTASQQRKLKGIVKAKTSSQRDVFRARIILGLAQGLSHDAIAKEQSVSLLAIGGTADPNRILEKLDRAWEAMLEEIYNPISGTSH